MDWSGLVRAISSISGRAQDHSPNKKDCPRIFTLSQSQATVRIIRGKGSLVPREKNLRPPFFPRWVSRAEAVLGDSCILTRRMERSTVFPEWKSSVRLFMKISGPRIAYPDFGSRLVLPLPGLMKNILRLFRFRRACEGWITLC